MLKDGLPIFGILAQFELVDYGDLFECRGVGSHLTKCYVFMRKIK